MASVLPSIVKVACDEKGGLMLSEMQVHTKNQHEVIGCRTKIRVCGAIKTSNSLTHLMCSTARIFKTYVATESVPSDGS